MNKQKFANILVSMMVLTTMLFGPNFKADAMFLSVRFTFILVPLNPHLVSLISYLLYCIYKSV